MKTSIKHLFVLSALIAGFGVIMAQSARGQIQETNGGADDLLYELVGNSITITGYTYPGGAFTIPATLPLYTYDSLTYQIIATNYFPVTSIGPFAFDDNAVDGWALPVVTSVTIPDSVTSIQGSAFYNSLDLTNVTIGNG